MEGEMDVYVERREVCRRIDRGVYVCCMWRDLHMCCMCRD